MKTIKILLTLDFVVADLETEVLIAKLKARLIAYSTTYNVLMSIEEMRD